MRANMYMSKCVYDQEITGSFLSMYVHPHASTLCACKKTLSLWLFLVFFRPSFRFPGFIMVACRGSLRNGLSGLLEMSMCR